MKSIIVVTGGVGFIGSNLIKLLLKKTNKKIISIDNYKYGSKKNQINNNRIKYIKSDTKNINKVLKKQSKEIDSVFHLENTQEFTKVSKTTMNVFHQISLEP